MQKDKHIPNIQEQGLYSPEFEHDACGVGMVANIKGIQSHEIISRGLDALCHLGHRGASGADPETGDGAGIMCQIPHDFFVQKALLENTSLPNVGDYGVGMVFIPQDDSNTIDQYKQTILNSIEQENFELIWWRVVPVDSSKIGKSAKEVQPNIFQFFVSKTQQNSYKNIDLSLYILRRNIEQQISSCELKSDDFYICSLSSSTIVYKGLLVPEQVAEFFIDLNDETFHSSFALVHSRFSTNTLGSWKLAHPYRFVVHNGEINTVKGNVNWMLSREHAFKSNELGDDLEKIKPITAHDQSDTAALDNALELLLATGRSIEHSMMMMIPEAWGDNIEMSPEKRAFYDYHSSMMEPWDGPALVVGTDGKKVCAVLDRNGLRPCRYLVTKDDLLIMGSETGVIEVPPENILFKERIYPGRMFLLDTESGQIINDAQIKSSVSQQQPYEKWLEENRISINNLNTPVDLPTEPLSTFVKRQNAFGYTLEELRMLIDPMATTAYEPTGSMGNDAALAFLSDHNPLLFNYFKQLFAQVSNPPLDAIREELVTSLKATIGEERNLFEETPLHARQITLPHPIINNEDLGKLRECNQNGIKSETISCLFNPSAEKGIEIAIDQILKNSENAINQGASILILSDRGVDESNAPIPALLYTSAVHHHLISIGLRSKVGLVIETGEAREVAHFALLIGFGAGAINPYFAIEIIQKLAKENELSIQVSEENSVKNYLAAAHKGILKTMSKMGISTIQSYRGAQIFEAIGLNQEFISKYFNRTISRIGGIGLKEIQTESINRHTRGYKDAEIHSNLDILPGGEYQWRRDGIYHMWNPNTISSLQHAVKTNNWETYQQFASFVDEENVRLSTIRGLLDFKNSGNQISLDEVEPAKEIVKRFATGAISLGSISREAHETLAIAMNRIHARSNTGEGGEDSVRFTLDKNGDSRNSSIKQVASGRFGVTINYLTNSTDIQIKMAQGAKPGEGGQLPGHKIDEYIGSVRHSTPGVELISPPPHHDIYSIEDLAQLIHDLKNANPQSRIHVKLVAEAGVGTIAAGVSKGHADVVLISGSSGGTGAAAETSIKHAGLPWELGVAEAQQVLVMNDLRGRIVLQADGQLKTGRDVAVACLLGAEEFGLATGPLIAMGCIMLRKCHMNTCSVGIATQDPELRKKFSGKPEHVINYFFFIAEQLRQIMADLGIRSINEMIGRVDLLEPRKNITHWKTKDIDFSQILFNPGVSDKIARFCIQKQDHGLEKSLDQQLIKESKDSLINSNKTTITKNINNSFRTVGTTLSHEIAKHYGEKGLPDETIKLNLNGSAGQSFGAFLNKGIFVDLKGDANDYFCKGLSGGKVIVQPPSSSSFTAEENIIIGNVALYGATGGEVYINGIAGERFAVRNSGANAVVEGVGDHGCEYMTRGKIVILGITGRNFAAGMSGGEAYIFDPHKTFEPKCNMGLVSLEKVSDEDESELFKLVSNHFKYTNSATAEKILNDWKNTLRSFIKVMPNDYKRVLEELKNKEVSVNG
ncbi:MAG: glutamate synthase large subunit [Dehalococcoidia bacterium]